jgi:hypothetical protein
VSQRRRTSFADILNSPPEEQPRAAEPLPSPEPVATSGAAPARAGKRNKAVDPAYTKLTAYIPRTLASAVKVAMALDTTTDQSDYIEQALVQWLTSNGRSEILRQTGYSAIESQH